MLPNEDKEIREIAKLIYEAVFLPGREDGGDIMPTFEKAEADSLGAFARVIAAAQAILRRERL